MRRACHRRDRNRRHGRCARPVAGRLARRVGPAHAPRSTRGSGEIAMTSVRVGFIGLGAMGSRMAANLQKSGSRLTVFNRTRDKAESLLAKGAAWGTTPAAVAEQAEVLFTMLAHPAAVEEAALGQNGFLDRLRPQALWIDCSTVNPSFSRELASHAQARKARFLDAPVAGSRAAAPPGGRRCFSGASAAGLPPSRPLPA